MFGVLGLEHATVRRVPWVSIALAAGMIVASVYAWSHPRPPPSPQAIDAAKAAVQFKIHHPEVRIHKRFLEAYPVVTFSIGIPMPFMARPTVDPDVAASDQATYDGLVKHALSFRHETLWQRYGLVPARGLHQLGVFTHVFLVGGIASLVLDLFMFYIVALVLEDVFGRPLFLLLFLGGALAAAAATVALQPNGTFPVLGPLGALGACFGAFVVRFRHENLMVRYTSGGDIHLVPAWTWGFVWAFRVLMALGGLGFLTSGLPSEVRDVISHSVAVVLFPQLAAIGFGIGLTVLIAVLDIEARFVDPVVEGDAFHQHPSVLAAADALAQGDRAGARSAFEAALRDDPRNLDALLGLLRLAVDEGDLATAHRQLGRLITSCLTRRDFDTIEVGLQELGPSLDPDQLRPATAYKVAMELGERLPPDIRERLLRSGGNAEGLLGAKSRLAAAELDLNVLGRRGEARDLAEAVLAQPGLDPSLAERARAIADGVPPSASGLELGGGGIAAAVGLGVSVMAASTGIGPGVGPSFEPSGLELATDPPAPPRAPNATAGRFEGRTPDGYKVRLGDGRIVALPGGKIREVAAGVLDRFESGGTAAPNIVVLDLVLGQKAGTAQCLRFDSRAMGLETLFAGMAPAAGFRALVGEIFEIPGISLRPPSLSQGLPRFPDLAAFEAAAYA